MAVFRQFSSYKLLEIIEKCQKIHSIGPLTFAKDSKNAKGFISMQIVTKIMILMKNCSITIELQQNPEN